MQGTILVVVVLIIGLVIGSYITAGLSKKFEWGKVVLIESEAPIVVYFNLCWF
jgi:hypothetical protein